jgi:hypothetical protein
MQSESLPVFNGTLALHDTNSVLESVPNGEAESRTGTLFAVWDA